MNPYKVANDIVNRVKSKKEDYSSIAYDLSRERPIVVNLVLKRLHDYPDFVNYFVSYMRTGRKGELVMTSGERELVRIVNELKRRGKWKLAASIVKVMSQWERLPRGWTWESLDKFARSLTKRTKTRHKGFVYECVKKMKGKVSDPYAFCASLKDRFLAKRPGEKYTYWRTGRKSKRR